MQFDKNKITEALGKVNMPGTGVSIVEAKAIKAIDTDDNRVKIEIETPIPSLNIRKKLENQVLYLIKKIYPYAGIEVKVLAGSKQKQEEIKEETSLKGVKNIIAIASGKGGVGKSTLTANLAVALVKKGYRVALVDADVYGPSQPTMFNVEDERMLAGEVNGKTYMIPVESYGVKLQSVGFFAPKGKAMAWRGAMASSALRQMLFETLWGDIDYMLVDLPPGTGDLQLSLVQASELSGVILITTPQAVALADALRALELFQNEQINVPVLGVVENMSYFVPEDAPDKKYHIFGRSGGKLLAEDHNLPFFGEIPLVEDLREASDTGMPLTLEQSPVIVKAFASFADKLVKSMKK